MKILFSIPGAIIVGSILISLSILLSSGIIRIKGVNSTGVLGTNSPSTSATSDSQAEAKPTPDTTPVRVTLDDDPVLGDKNAKITLVEFSDYECPFCKRHFDQTYEKLKKDYIDTGKVKLVYRDLPLDFHQNAHKEAQAAECSREQGGDATYFKFHDEVFTKTTSNGTGLALDQLPVIASELGLNVASFQQCLDNEKYKDEVDKDIADAKAAQAFGTPTFYLFNSGVSEINGAKSDPDSEYPQNIFYIYDKDNKLVGVRIEGALSFESFKKIIDEKLNG